MCSDWGGGAFVAWTDSRTGTRDIYAHHILSTGAVDPGWPLDGQPICTTIGDQTNTALVPDGSGGVVIVWQDNRNGAPDIFAQRVSSSGQVVAGWPANGAVVCTAADSQVTPVAVGDGLGGALIAWQDRRSGVSMDIFAHHLQADGTLDPGWPTAGLALCDAAGRQDRPRMLADNAGGAIILWSDPRNGAGTDDVYAGRVLASGSTPSGWPINGRVICAASGIQRLPVLVSDGSGGAIITWVDERAGSSNPNIYAQRVLPGGAVDPSWPVDGSPICTVTGIQLSPALAEDGAHGAIIAWPDLRAGTASDVYAHRVRADGSLDPAWPTDGRALCTAAGDQSTVAVVPTGSGGVLVTWTDFRNTSSNTEIYAQRVGADGVVDTSWPLDGAAISTATANQASPKVVADGAGGAIAIWTDSRNGSTNSDIYGQRVQANGQLGGDVVGVPPSVEIQMRIAPARPNPLRGNQLAVHYWLPSALPARLELLDVSGRLIAVRVDAGGRAGDQELELASGGSLRPGVYVVRLVQGADSRSLRVVVIN